MKRIAILTSGGDSPGMNAAIRAVVRSAIYNGMQVYGVDRGYEGLMDGDLKELSVSSVSDILQRGGTILRTARSERFKTDDGIKRAYEILKTFEIDALVVIGGDGSFRGALKLSKLGVTVMGLPGTIDNDMAYTDYTIGFDTAVNTVLSAVSNIRDTSSSHERTTIIEVMGRECGDIALYSGLAGGAEFILIPEVKADLNALCRKILQGRHRGKLHSIIMNAEGSGVSSKELADYINKLTGIEAKIVVPGYIQRGGSPSARDRILASRMGNKAVELINYDAKSSAIGVVGEEIVSMDLEDAINTERRVAFDMIELADILSI